MIDVQNRETGFSRPPSTLSRLRIIAIEHVEPELDAGLYPIKRVVGDVLTVRADIFKHGHDAIGALLKFRTAGEPAWHEAPMHHVDNDRWEGSFALAENKRYRYTVEAFVDQFRTWRDELEKRVEAGQDVAVELAIGQAIIARAADRAGGEDRTRLLTLVEAIDAAHGKRAVSMALSEQMAEVMATHPDRSNSDCYERELEVVVDRVRAAYGAWYEMFPRSQGTIAGRSATLRECELRLPEIKAMGFDVIYLPPIHPIGHTNRKGANNSILSGPADPGCPYAIGNEGGGHKAVDPALGTIDDFDHFVETAESLGMEIALDFAIQCSPDHPYVREHPEWFQHHPDGSIKFAENPPKKYEDIVALDLMCANREALWQELKSIVIFWRNHGVKIFRVDNPHTKPVAFWEWLIDEAQREHPEVVFLAEAFTRPKMLNLLAKAGFSQSYTYFTWRNTKSELQEYFTELTQTKVADYLRGNMFVNTPDILPWVLQYGGRPAFKMRLTLAATLSPVYGIYNGFELCENTAIPDKEEYLNSEKYEYKVWDWNRPGNIKDYIATVNRIRAENAALHLNRNLQFFTIDNDNIIAYGKANADRSNIIVVVVNLDPHTSQEAMLDVPIWDFGIPDWEEYVAHDLLTSAHYHWRGVRQYIRLDPAVEPAHILRIEHFHQA